MQSRDNSFAPISDTLIIMGSASGVSRTIALKYEESISLTLVSISSSVTFGFFTALKEILTSNVSAATAAKCAPIFATPLPVPSPTIIFYRYKLFQYS